VSRKASMNAEPKQQPASDVEAPHSAADDTAFRDYRKRVQDVIERMELEYDKALLAYIRSGSAFPLLFTTR
jgi:hypothetical protein